MMEHDAQGKPSAGVQAPYTVKEFADRARLSRNAVYQMIARNELAAMRFGGAIRLPRDKIDQLLRGEAIGS
jgi:excisionase family DNA binding protein